LMLDPKIRDWVLIPIFLVMVLQGVLRDLVTRLLSSKKKPELSAVKDAQLLRRSAVLRANASWLSPSAFAMRKSYFTDKENGVFSKEMPKLDPMEQLSKNPGMGMDMMKQNMTYMVPQMVMMGWISYFFSGFVIVKVPFNLSMRFKTMLQRGLELQTLDVSYTSSLSLYFLLMFGLRGLFSLVLGENSETDEAKMMQAQMGMAGGMGPQQPDMNKVYQGEKEAIDMVPHEWLPHNPESSILRKGRETRSVKLGKQD